MHQTPKPNNTLSMSQEPIDQKQSTDTSQHLKQGKYQNRLKVKAAGRSFRNPKKKKTITSAVA